MKTTEPGTILQAETIGAHIQQCQTKADTISCSLSIPLEMLCCYQETWLKWQPCFFKPILACVVLHSGKSHKMCLRPIQIHCKQDEILYRFPCNSGAQVHSPHFSHPRKPNNVRAHRLALPQCQLPARSSNVSTRFVSNLLQCPD
jgi:hypothetical protein